MMSREDCLGVESRQNHSEQQQAYKEVFFIMYSAVCFFRRSNEHGCYRLVLFLRDVLRKELR